VPTEARHRIHTQDIRAVYKLWTDMPEIRNEFGSLAKVDSAEPWWTAMPVKMDVKHRGLTRQGSLQRLPNRARAHHRSHTDVWDVILISDRMITVSEDYPARRVQCSYLAGKESDPLSSKRMRSA